MARADLHPPPATRTGRTWLGVLLFAMLAAGCDAPLAPTSEAELEPHLTIARGIALAMTDAEVRLGVRDAMRDTRWTQHKLILHEFLSTGDGQLLLNAAATATGMSAAEFVSVAEQLPQMDFYMPLRRQRTEWRGTPNYIVAAALDLDAEIVQGFFPGGADVILHPDDQRLLSEWFILLIHPAEPKGILAPVPGDGVGETIQPTLYERYWAPVTSSDPRGGVTRSWQLIDKTALNRAPAPTATLAPERDIAFSHTDTTNSYFTFFNTTKDDGVGWGDCEVRWDVVFYVVGDSVNGNQVYDPDFDCPGSTPDGWSQLMIDDAPLSLGDRLAVTFIEEDSFSDDNYGTLEWYPPDEGVVMSNSNWSAEMSWGSGSGGGSSGGDSCLDNPDSPECQT